MRIPPKSVNFEDFLLIARGVEMILRTQILWHWFFFFFSVFGAV